MNEKIVREGFAPEGQLPPEQRQYTCMNQKCPKFNYLILGRTRQEAEDLAKARFAKECPTAILREDGIHPYTDRVADTWAIQIEHGHNDKGLEPGSYTFEYNITDGQPEEKAVTEHRIGFRRPLL
jgi:hypothetical protein